MKTTLRMTVLAMALTAGAATANANDPAGSTAPPVPRDTGAPAVLVPMPTLPGGPNFVGGAPQLPPVPPTGGAPALRDAADDHAVDLILLGASDLRYPHDVCYGMITCCNSFWVQGCDANQFENICTYYGGEVVVQTFSDGSLNYECYEAE
ncbi:MAG: hypothetical protein R3F55_04520 [Alphaproteobacteria bacterium]